MQIENNIFADIIFGIIFSILGANLIFRKAKIIDALLTSNKVFWDKLGFAPDDKKGMLVTNIMIPVIGTVFLIVGLMLIIKIINYFVK